MPVGSFCIIYRVHLSLVRGNLHILPFHLSCHLSFSKSDLLSNALFPHTAKARAFGVPLLLRRQTTVRLSTGPNSVRGRGEGKMGNRNSIYSGSRLDLT